VFQRKDSIIRLTWTTRVLPNSKLSEVINGDPSKIVPLPQNLVETALLFLGPVSPKPELPDRTMLLIRMQEVNVTYNLPAPPAEENRHQAPEVYAQGNEISLPSWP